MGVERIDYSSDQEFEQARDMESYEAQQWDDRRQAEEAERQLIEEEIQKESVPAETVVIPKADIIRILKTYKSVQDSVVEDRIESDMKQLIALDKSEMLKRIINDIESFSA